MGPPGEDVEAVAHVVRAGHAADARRRRAAGVEDERRRRLQDVEPVGEVGAVG